MLTWSIFSFHAPLPDEQFLWRFRNDEKVMYIHVFSWTSSTKLLGDGFQNQDERYGAQARALLNSQFKSKHHNKINAIPAQYHYHYKIFSQGATNTHSASGIFIQPRLNAKFVKRPRDDTPDSKVHGANMGPTWVLSAPNRPHVGPMNLAIRDVWVLGAWSRSTKAMHNVWLTAWNLTCIWHTMNMVSGCRVQAWSQTACHRCAHVVPSRSKNY